MKVVLLSLILGIVSFVALASYPIKVNDINKEAWLISTTFLVMLMIPGLAFFYAGVISRKNIVTSLVQNYMALAGIGIVWVVIGFSLAFSKGNGFIGNNTFFLLKGFTNKMLANNNLNEPHYAFMLFQMVFALITPILITGAVAERLSFKSWILVLVLWSIFAYCPVAHWVWGAEGWIKIRGGLDFAGGMVVHLTAGIAALVTALIHGNKNDANDAPNDIPMIMLGAGLLWFGWFGFNSGSIFTTGYLADHAFVNIYLGASAALISWMVVDWCKFGSLKASGSATGLVVGLVVISPAAGYVSIESALIIGTIGGVLCNLAAWWLKKYSKIYGALDVFVCHGIGGALGIIMTGLFASKAINPTITLEGLLICGETSLCLINMIGVIAVGVYAAIVTYTIISFVRVITAERVNNDTQTIRLSFQHALKNKLIKTKDYYGAVLGLVIYILNRE